VRRLRADAEGIKEPHFFRFKFTVGDPIAARLMVLPPLYREWAVRDAIEKTFAGALARAQGVFVIHYHGGARRPFGHPHAHAVLGPRLQDGVALQYGGAASIALPILTKSSYGTLGCSPRSGAWPGRGGRPRWARGR
jgi:hypothetical protein